jgi:hypothetical protein
LNVHNISDIRQIEIHRTEPLLPGSSYLEVDIAAAKLEKYKSPCSDQILAELIQPLGETLLSVIHKLINIIWNKKELCIIVTVHKKTNKTDCNNYHEISLL